MRLLQSLVLAIRKAWAFVKRDFSIQTSYKLAFVMNFAGIFISVFTFYFISKLLGRGASPYLQAYGGNYFSFVLIGIAFNSYLGTALSSFSNSIRSEQMMGTLEAMLVTPTRIPTLIISMSLWNYVYSSIRVVTYLLIGAVFFGVDFSKMNIGAAIIILLLTIICFSSIGIMSAGFIMIFKQGDPINWVISTFSGLFGGVFFPITLLPAKLRVISYLLPLTYSLRSLRHALLQGYSFKALSPDIAVLALFTAVLFPVGILVFKYAIRRAKSDGSLVHY